MNARVLIQRPKLVVVGNGMAGMRTVEELLKIAPDLYDITVFGAEPHPNYNRILLSPVLAGEQTLSELLRSSRLVNSPQKSAAIRPSRPSSIASRCGRSGEPWSWTSWSKPRPATSSM